jgi:hypothetical protein
MRRDGPDAIPVLTPEGLSSLATECRMDPGAADPTLAIQELPEPVYDHTLSKAEISSLENEISGQTREAAGLTLVVAGSVQTRIAESEAPSGGGCVVVEGVRVFPVRQVLVYVAREYPVGSCNYNSVRRHEEKHVAIARRLVSEYRSRLLRALNELGLEARGFPARVDGRNASTDRIATDVQSAVQSVIGELEVRMKNANRLLDEANTERTLRECPFW